MPATSDLPVSTSTATRSPGRVARRSTVPLPLTAYSCETSYEAPAGAEYAAALVVLDFAGLDNDVLAEAISAPLVLSAESQYGGQIRDRNGAAVVPYTLMSSDELHALDTTQSYLIVPNNAFYVGDVESNATIVGEGGTIDDVLTFYVRAMTQYGNRDWGTRIRVIIPRGSLAGDSDGDGVTDDQDGCPSDVDKTSAGDCGCGTPDTDTDGDGTADCNDGCPDDPDKADSGACGCGTPDTDSDSDGTPDCKDVPPLAIEMVTIPDGQFDMGDGYGFFDENPVHVVHTGSVLHRRLRDY